MKINIMSAVVNPKHPYTIEIQAAVVPNNQSISFKFVANSVDGFPYYLRSNQKESLEKGLKNIFGDGTKIRNQNAVNKCLSVDNVIEFDY